VLKKLQAGFPSVHIALNNNREAAAQDLVYLGLHLPAIGGSLAEIKEGLRTASLKENTANRPNWLLPFYNMDFD